MAEKEKYYSKALRELKEAYAVMKNENAELKNEVDRLQNNLDVIHKKYADTTVQIPQLLEDIEKMYEGQIRQYRTLLEYDLTHPTILASRSRKDTCFDIRQLVSKLINRIFKDS